MEHGTGDYHEDRRVLSDIFKGVPLEMLRTLAVKDTVKLAWDMIKRLHVGCKYVQKARAWTQRGEFEQLVFKDGELVKEFSLRLIGIVNDLQILDDPVSEYKAVIKFLRCVPKKYRQMAMAIESLVDLKTITVEEVV